MSLLTTFGKTPEGKELEKVKASPNFREGSFKNLSVTKMMAEGQSMVAVMWKFINKPANCFPSKIIPSVKTDLKNIQSANPFIVWFGHSSYFIRINNKNILVDPVFSGHASPFSFSTKSFAGANVYGVDDMPEIDILFITHDHYDHLDFDTVVKLKPKVKHICTSLGVASHLTYWGYDENCITEFDWRDSATINAFSITAASARHFSGRGLVRNKTLWSSFILQAPQHTIYIGGDSGYDTHFKAIGEKYGPFDIVMLECGQYNTAWPHIHMLPPETAQAAVDLKAKMLLPVHWGKFSLSLHAWNEPPTLVTAAAQQLNMPVTTPLIGEPVVIGESYPATRWWQV